MSNHHSSIAFDDDDGALAFNISEACGEHARFRDGMELDDDELPEIGDYCVDPDDEHENCE